jgi:serine/threonine protein kinase/tetratricopeptide (TPR) repeat protein/TolB-like protein
MSRDPWLRIKEVLAAALEAHPDQRAALLDRLCDGDTLLRVEVESLLQADAIADTFLDRPLLDPIDATPAEPDIGRTIGSYIIEKSVGRGGMGAVYLARRADQAFERHVAIKMIRRGMDSALVVRRFRHERQILASLEHPNIAALFDGGTTPDGLPYFVMEYVAGTRIDRYADERRLNTIDRIRLCLPILDAVQHAHDRRIVHRDIKPTNVMVSADGRPKLLDFGIATILNPGAEGPSTVTTLGRPMTPEYASPEQIRGEPVTTATDVYALGVLVYELLTGHRPYRLVTNTPEEVARVVCEQDPERPSTVISQIKTSKLEDGTITTVTPVTVSATRDGTPELLRNRLSGSIDDILLKAIRKEAHERYASVKAFADDLRRYVDQQPVGVSWDSRRYRAKRTFRRYRTALAVAALVIVAVAATALLTSRRSGGAASTTQAPAATAAPLAPRPSVAVIGFRNLSERPADGWLSTAMAEMLTTELAADGQLRVLPAERVARATVDLGEQATSTVSRAAIDRLRNTLASDLVVFGTFIVNEGPEPRTVRIDVRVDRTGQDSVSVASTGDLSGLFALIAAVGKELRAQLGLQESSPDAARGVRAAFPQTTEATKLYAEGAARLRVLDAVGAKDLLEQAASKEPDNPVIQTALAAAWTSLGYDARAASAAKKAFDASGDLGREQRLNVEGRLYAAERKWPNAVDVYRTLWGFFSDNLEYGLQLAAAQTAAGQAKDALKTVEAMRRVRAPQNEDPRIDLERSQASSALGDFPTELKSAQDALRRAERSGSRHLIARARLLEGRSYFNQGQLTSAEQSLEIARKMFIEVGDRAGAALALNSMGSVMADMHDLPRAERMYREALSANEQIGARRAMSGSLNNLGIVLKDQRRFGEARAAYERALAIQREIGDKNWTAISLSNIGVVHFEQDRLSDAAKYYRESLALAREIADRRGEVRALHNLAIVDREMGNLTAARSGYEASLPVRAAIGDKRGGIVARVELGMVLLAQGELQRAREVEEEGLKLSREIGLKAGEAQTLYQLGEIALASGDLAAARRHHNEALAIRESTEEIRTLQESRLALASLTFEEGHVVDAERQARELLAQLAAEPQGPLQPYAHLLVARARLASGDTVAAQTELAAARKLSASTERIELRRSVAMAEAELDAAQGNRESARQRLTQLRATLARGGMALAELECRTALVRLDRAEKRPTAAADAAALEKDAKARHAGLVLRALAR